MNEILRRSADYLMTLHRAEHAYAVADSDELDRLLMGVDHVAVAELANSLRVLAVALPESGGDSTGGPETSAPPTGALLASSDMPRDGDSIAPGNVVRLRGSENWSVKCR